MSDGEKKKVVEGVKGYDGVFPPEMAANHRNRIRAMSSLGGSDENQMRVGGEATADPNPPTPSTHKNPEK